MNTSGSATSHLSARQFPLARPASAARRESALFAAALGAVGLHIVDDNFLQPESGTAATGHLLSGLVPLALIVGAAACYGRARPGFRAVLALVFGVLGVLAGTEALYYTANGGPSGDDYTGYLSVASGLLLLGVGCATLWRSRRNGRAPRGSRSPGESSPSAMWNAMRARICVAIPRSERGSMERLDRLLATAVANRR